MAEKLTPEEIKKALECCGDTDDGCLHCPLYGSPAPECGMRLCRESLELHNSQQAEIEGTHKRVMRLDSEREEWSRSATAKKLKNIELQAAFENSVKATKHWHREAELNANEIIKLQTEIERLTINMNAFGLGMKREKERADTIRAEAIKEFAERLKKWLKDDVTLLTQQRYIMEGAIEKAYEEMVGDDK